MLAAPDSRAFWQRRRLRYNVALLIAGLAAFACYALIVELAPRPLSDVDTGQLPEITLFTMAFQAVGYLVAMGIANILYGLGQLSERLIAPEDPAAFRERTFKMGLWFSVSLPFLVPLLVGTKVLLHG